MLPGKKSFIPLTVYVTILSFTIHLIFYCCDLSFIAALLVSCGHPIYMYIEGTIKGIHRFNLLILMHFIEVKSFCNRLYIYIYIFTVIQIRIIIIILLKNTK